MGRGLYLLTGTKYVQNAYGYVHLFLREKTGTMLCLLFPPLPSLAKPFVEICMKQHNKYEAKKYASRVGPEQKVKALLLVGYVK
jgi:hypothetical protein